MTLSEIEIQANRGNIATGDFDMRTTLRQEIIPEFLDGVGDVKWRRKTSSITTVAGTRDYALPDDFFRMTKIVPPYGNPLGATEDGLKYYGEDQDLILKYEQVTTNGQPEAFDIIQSSGGAYKTLRFNCPADDAYVFPYIYQWSLAFKNFDEDLDLVTYFPEHFHHALVSGLRREIMLDRFGKDDPRFLVEDGKFNKAIQRAGSLSNREPARRNYGVYAS